MYTSIPPAGQPFMDLIKSSHVNRGKGMDDLEIDSKYQVPHYVVRLCIALREQIESLDIPLDIFTCAHQLAGNSVMYFGNFARFVLKLDTFRRSKASASDDQFIRSIRGDLEAVDSDFSSITKKIYRAVNFGEMREALQGFSDQPLQ